MTDDLGGMTSEPDMDDLVQVYVDRCIKALMEEFKNDDQVPRFAVVAETPPEGHIGIASTGDDAPDVHRMLTLGASSVRNAMTPEQRREARLYWDQMRAGLERRN